MLPGYRPEQLYFYNLNKYLLVENVVSENRATL